MGTDAWPGDARSGAVIVVQRFGGALNLNVHLHALVLDGVFARTGDGRLRFHRAAAPTTADIADVLAAIVPAVRRRLAVGGSGYDAMEGADRFADAAPGAGGGVGAGGCWRWAACRDGGPSGWAKSTYCMAMKSRPSSSVPTW